ncbi:uncharacterized protein LOC129290241 isoform X2 [Prosopis cineraria]|uniref:uncharacterized protein LOC129290241 isoform X2 n=1 Tax=Prosopis cineraria TaxID=364024 RepID=UPI00240F8897|nr:uncharacterized protein LOC129290241 isoform X2 [Prosopis cineraria]
MGGGTIHVGSSVPQPRSYPVVVSPSPPPPPPSSNSKLPVSTDNGVPFSHGGSGCCCFCHSEIGRKLEVVHVMEEKRSRGCLHNYVFDAVPSQMEVEDALIALQSFLQAVTSGALQQNSCAYDSSILLSQGYNKLYDAYLLLQSDPSIKRLVTSLSSDKTVWNAVMNVVNQKLESLPNPGAYFIRWSICDYFGFKLQMTAMGKFLTLMVLFGCYLSIWSMFGR